MKTLLSFFCFLFLLNIITQAQSLTELYSDQIPKKFLNNESDRTNLEANMQYSVTLSPKLLFLYFRYLENAAVGKIKNPDSNYTSLLSYARSSYKKEKLDWQLSLFDKIKAKTSSGLRKADAKKHIILEVIPESENIKNPSELPIDTNKMQYLIWRFNGRSKEMYDSTINYQSLNKNFYTQISKKLNENFKNFSQLEQSVKLECIDEAIKYWFLWTNPHLSNEPLIFDLSDELLLIHNEGYDSSPGYSVALQILAPTENLGWAGDHIINDKPIETFINPIQLPYNSKINYLFFAKFSVEKRFTFNKYKTELGYLDAKLGYYFNVHNSKVSNAGTELYRFTYDVVSGSVLRQIVYKPNKISESSLKLFTIEFSTPLFYFDKNLHVSLSGLGVFGWQERVFEMSKLYVINDRSQQTESLERAQPMYVKDKRDFQTFGWNVAINYTFNEKYESNLIFSFIGKSYTAGVGLRRQLVF